MKSLVFRVEWGGLGDMFFYSHIPRIAKETGAYDRVHVQCKPRHGDYYNVFHLNPHCDGFDSESTPYPEGTSPNGIPGCNMLDLHMLQLGLDDGLRDHEPEFYYKPKIREEWRDLVVYDGNFVSGVGCVNLDRLREVLARERVNAEMKRRFGRYSLNGLSQDGKSFWCGTGREIETPTLFDYCDLIASCKRFVCLASGGATLAAALRVPSLVLYGEGQPEIFHHSKQHVYEKV